MIDPVPSPVEHLLTHREWVRSVARALVGSGADADDLEAEMHRIVGRVLGPDGAVPGVPIRVLFWPPGAETLVQAALGPVRAHADEDGRFEIGRLAEGRYRLAVAGPESVPTRFVVPGLHRDGKVELTADAGGKRIDLGECDPPAEGLALTVR